MPGRGSVSTVEERRQCITIVYDDLLWNALVVERASKQFDHVNTFHRSTSSVGFAGADGEFPVTCAATGLMHDFRRKKSTTISPALWLLSLLEGNVQEMTEGVQFEMVSKYTHFLRIATPYLY